LIKLTPQDNESGDDQFAQGFGCVGQSAQTFHPVTDFESAAQFFEANGYVVLSDCLTIDELRHLNMFCDRTQKEYADSWGLGDKRKPHHRNQGLIYSQPLLDHPELDVYVQHDPVFSLVGRLLGGTDRVRFAELNFRETPEDAGRGTMNFHHDAVTRDRLERTPYMPCDWICAIHYLNDVDERSPAFCVVPQSNRFETLKEANEALGDAYCEVPIRGPAGTCVVYDTATYHTRLDGDGHKGRRTWHQYYARGGWLRSALPTTDRYMRPPSPSLTDWNLFPERLANHSDPAIRLYFSHWNSAQGEWAASGYDPEVRNSMPRGTQ
jgi:hypothetical protein